VRLASVVWIAPYGAGPASGVLVKKNLAERNVMKKVDTNPTSVSVLSSVSLLAALAAMSIAAALVMAPNIAVAAGAGAPSGGGETTTQSPPAQQKKPHAKKNRSSLDDFIAGYKAAYALIYEKGDYEAAITALRALDHDDNADVANLIGYASRKLGRYDDAKVWYERSLAADPNHAVTWSYYGMWQAEQGNLLKAKDDLEKVRLICGTDCEPYKMLKDVIDGTKTY
jgi:tetratricopeptide (TPR) repeat protein